MMGWDGTEVVPDGWMGKDDMCLSYLLTLLNVRVKTDIINQSNQSINREMKCGSPGGDIWLGGRVCSLLVQRTGCGPRGMLREAKRSI